MQNCRFGKDVNLELPKDEPPSRQASIKYIYIHILKSFNLFCNSGVCLSIFPSFWGVGGGLHDVIT